MVRYVLHISEVGWKRHQSGFGMELMKWQFVLLSLSSELPSEAIEIRRLRRRWAPSRSVSQPGEV
jgi:hypothetical protein